MIEAAIVLPLLFTLLLGAIEIGGALKSYSSTANAVRAGGRMASVAGNDAMADQMILERVAQEAAGLGEGEIEYVVIWHATGPDDSVPASCIRPTPVNPNTQSEGTPGSGPGRCNIYFRPQAPGGAFDMARGRLDEPPEHFFGCTGASDPERDHKVDCSWPGSTRKILQSPRGQTPVQRPDYVGVHVRAAHDYYTGILGDTLTITDNGINLLEPQGYALTGA